MTDFLRNLLLVALGGSIGSAARYACVFLWQQLGWSAAWAILAINLIGSFAIGFFMGYGLKTWSQTGWLLLAMGILGGYTTFSAFSMHVLEMLQRGTIGLALINIATSVIGGIFCALLGFYLANSLIKV